MERTEGALGVAVTITIASAPSDVAESALDAAFAEVRRWELILSSYNPRSELRKLESTWQPGHWTEISEDFATALAAAMRIATESGGAFDPTIGALTRLWRDARGEGAPPADEAIAAAQRATGLPLLELDFRQQRIRPRHPDLQLDLGGFGKGWIADRALDRLRELGFPAALIDLGGDLAVGSAPAGEEGWRIGRPNARGTTERLILSHCGIATSGDAEQRLVVGKLRLSHILDPRRRTPLIDAPTITVRAPTAAAADAWATALSVDARARDRLARREGFEVWSTAPESTER